MEVVLVGLVSFELGAFSPELAWIADVNNGVVAVGEPPARSAWIWVPGTAGTVRSSRPSTRRRVRHASGRAERGVRLASGYRRNRERASHFMLKSSAKCPDRGAARTGCVDETS